MPVVPTKLVQGKEAMAAARQNRKKKLTHNHPSQEFRRLPKLLTGRKIHILEKQGEPVCIGQGQYGFTVLAQQMETKELLIIKFYKRGEGVSNTYWYQDRHALY